MELSSLDLSLLFYTQIKVMSVRYEKMATMSTTATVKRDNSDHKIFTNKSCLDDYVPITYTGWLCYSGIIFCYSIHYLFLHPHDLILEHPYCFL